MMGGNVAVRSTDAMLHGGGGGAHEPQEAKVIQALDNEKAIALQRNLTEDPAFAPVLDYLTTTRGLKKEVLQKYCVGAIEQPFRNADGDSVGVACIAFPWMARQSDLDAMGFVLEETPPSPSPSSSDDDVASPAAPAPTTSQDQNLFDVVRLKIRAIDDKSKQRLVPKGGSWGLFGWNTVPAAADAIVVTEGEFDAMAVHQATGMPAVSLPNGCRSLPPNVLPLLERFAKVYLWMDNDAAGQASVDKFAAKCGLTRCYIVRPPPAAGATTKAPKDANDALLAGLDLQHLLDRAERIPHSQIATFDELRREVLEEILNPIRACGVQSRSLPSLNRLLKGHRMGEVTVLTGPTGCGKTTLLSQLSLDLCGQGVSTLWGSFEIKNTRLIHKMLSQLAGRSLQGDLKAFEAAADRFEALPMYFLRFFGSTDVDEVLDAMEYAVYAHDVQHILLDNVQFMMAGQGRGFDKFERQDAALDKFRKFASQKNIHVTLVIHPRKEQEDADLSLSSVFGTAKATQEADNVLILQRVKGAARLDVRKNRFDGTLGAIPLYFDPDAVSLKEFHEDTMDDRVASVDLEAQMAMEQKQRQKKQQKQQVSVDEFVPGFHGPPEPQQHQHHHVRYAMNGANGAGPNHQYHGHDHGHPHDQPNGNDHRTNGGVNGGGVNGLNGSSSSSGGGGEPFASFTPIITR